MEVNKNIVIAVVLGVLVLIAAIQAVQLFGLKSRIGSNAQTSTINTPVATGSGNGGGAQLPSNLQNLPSMVGGC